MRSIGGRWRSTMWPMTCARMTPVSMAPARSIGRQACLASRPQATVTIRTMIGRPMGPKMIARMIMMMVVGSARRVRSQVRTGSSAAVLQDSGEDYREQHGARDHQDDGGPVEIPARRHAHEALLHDELFVEGPPPSLGFA